MESTDAAPPDDDLGELEPETPPLIDATGRVRLSFTRIDTHRNCPRKFRYAYLDRLPTAPSPHLSFGTSIHRALEGFYARKLPSCPAVQELLELLYEHWDHEGFEALERDEQVAYYRHAQDVLRRYHRRVASTYRLPLTTEAWFELPFDDAVVVGAIDRIDVDDDGDLHVIDYKTNRRAQPRERVARSLQLAIYALACESLYGRLPATVSLDFVVAGAVVRVDLADIDLDRARAAVHDAATSIRSRSFPATPNRLCEWCDFRGICPAWPDHADDGLGAAEARLASLQRSVRSQVREMRELEAGIERTRSELASREI
jgi:RecB family exonuclease